MIKIFEMSTIEEQPYGKEEFKNWEKNRRIARIFAGLMVIAAAGLFFLKEAGYFIPSWVFTWPVLLIAAGIISGVKHQFKHPVWIILISIGSLFLIGDIIPSFSFDKYKIPIILLIIGLVLIFKPKSRHRHKARCMEKHRHWNIAADASLHNSDDNYIVLNNVFAGTKKNIISKDFKGGDIKNTFGGCELNLMQADFTGQVIITIHQHFGGTKLIVPSNWIVQSEVACVFAGIEDERSAVNITEGTEAKRLILKGHIFMSGIEIVSF